MIKNAFILDNEDNLMQAIIEFKETSINIRMFDISYNFLGYMNIQLQENNRLYLSEIYCYDEYRGSGIATKLSELADFILQPYQGYVLRGVYYPTQMSKDLDNISRSKEELDARARSFYEKNGYEVLKYSDYLNNKEKYNFLNEKDDFYINNQLVDEIVFKVITPKSYHLYEDNGLIFNTSSEKKL